MRNFRYYDVIFVDIDDTLVYGFWTDLMAWTWSTFRNNFLSDCLMFLQEKFNIFKPNTKLLCALQDHPFVCLVTARKESKATMRLAQKLFPKKLCVSLQEGDAYEISKSDDIVNLIELGTDNPAEHKWLVAAQVMHEINMREDFVPNCCVIDDSKAVRYRFGYEGYDAFDPTVFIEKKIG